MNEWPVGTDVELWLDDQWRLGRIVSSGALLGMHSLPEGTVRVLMRGEGWTVTHDTRDPEVADCLRRRLDSSTL